MSVRKTQPYISIHFSWTRPPQALFGPLWRNVVFPKENEWFWDAPRPPSPFGNPLSCCCLIIPAVPCGARTEHRSIEGVFPGRCIPVSIQMGPGVGTYRKTGKVNTAREARRRNFSGCFRRAKRAGENFMGVSIVNTKVI